ncbi:uncharacterized protein TNCV_2061641 [Trichonephila clavipes]|nr:uncharacterized protein TNCV_2061641 [Trichonephila clavipes]
MARIVRHNDESVREGYIRNGGKEVKFFISALKAFQCNRHKESIWMIFYVVELLDDWNVDVPTWKYPKNLESPRLSYPGFGNDSKMMVMRVDVTTQVAPELQRRMRTGIFGSYCQKKQTEHSIRPVSSALLSYRYDSFKADRVQMLRAHWSTCS